MLQAFALRSSSSVLRLLRQSVALLLLLLFPGAFPVRGEEAAPGTFEEPLSLQGFTGLLTTPSAFTLSQGVFAIQWSRPRDPRFQLPQTSYFGTVGFLPWVELGGRIAQTNAAAGQAGLADLSAHFKLRAPLELLWPGAPLAVAVGSQDAGGVGSSSHFRSRYVVASAVWGPASASLGAGTGPDRMKGIFGGVQVRPWSFLHLLADWEGGNGSVGLRIDQGFELFRVPMRVGALARRQLAGDGRPFEWGLQLSAALSGSRTEPPPNREPLPPPSASLPTSAAASGAPSAATAPSAPSPLGASASRLDALAERLVEAGFEEVRVGQDGETLLVECENARFGHTELDGIGVALGLAARADIAGAERVALTLLRSGLRLAEISAPLSSIRRAFGLQAEPTAPALETVIRLRWHPEPREQGFGEMPPRNRRLLHGQLVLSPFFRTFVAHEYGVFDFAASIRPEIVEGLWTGASLYARWDIPIYWTSALADGQPLAEFRPSPALDHALLYQALSPLRGVHVLLGAGAFRVYGLGALAEILWTPAFADGLALGIQAGTLRVHPDDGIQASAVANARYYHAPSDLLLRLRAGRFYGQDDGFSTELSRFFGNTEVSFFYQRTSWAEAGIRVTIPLTPRADMRPGWVQLRGDRRWANALRTMVGSDRNLISAAVAVPPISPFNLDDVFLDAGRLSAGELAAQVGRLREGAGLAP